MAISIILFSFRFLRELEQLIGLGQVKRSIAEITAFSLIKPIRWHRVERRTSEKNRLPQVLSP
ncbi:MAG: hypothetical protein U9N81_00395 [Bacillota bacterium]|nr:hypothetical protein [Bacillota bacterium]